MNLPSYKSKKFTFSIKVSGISYHIFNIIFHTKQDMSSSNFMVILPHFSKTKGLVSKVTFPGNKTHTAKISLLPGGKTTSHLIKYTHWLDGNVHFSQDGKVFTQIKNISDRLDDGIGHVFTIQIKGLASYNKISEPTKQNDNSKRDLQFDFGSEVPSSIKFVAWWFRKSDVHLTTNSLPKNAEPKYYFKNPDGTIRDPSWGISPPEGSPLEGFTLFVTCRSMPIITKEKNDRFSFMGGFPSKSIRDDLAQDLQFLIATYPIRYYKAYLKRLGTIDLSSEEFGIS